MWTSKADEFDAIQLHSEMYDFSIAGFPLLWGAGYLRLMNNYSRVSSFRRAGLGYMILMVRNHLSC